MSKPDLDQQIRDVAKAWEDSAYYQNAERWTPLFWRPETPFRQMFDRLDLTSVVELACGHGRHSEQIVEKAGRIVMVDIFDQNLDHCRKRMARFDNVEFLKGNGKDFQPLPDESFTSLFCYDAMVHFAPDMVQSYLVDTARILKSGGLALFHHSNYSAAPGESYARNPHARNHMAIPLFAEFTSAAGLKLVEQRVIDWGGSPDLDAITLLRKV